MFRRWAWVLVLSGIGCGGNNATDGGGIDSPSTSDSGQTADGGMCVAPPPPMLDPTLTPPTPAAACPTASASLMIPAADEQTGQCCHRTLDANQATAPEMRVNFVKLTAPAGSVLTGQLIGSILNQSVGEERFNWLFRLAPGTGDAVTITTGFGLRAGDTAPSMYSFSHDPAHTNWNPATIEATLTGETVTAPAFDGTITIPVLDPVDPTMVTLELALRDVQIDVVELSDNRNCIGWRIARPGIFFEPRGILSGYIDVAASMAGMIVTPAVSTTLCSAIAGDLSPTYCTANQQPSWIVKPDSLCDATGCRTNTACVSPADVCDPATTCNAWHVVAQFAASGVDIVDP